MKSIRRILPIFFIAAFFQMGCSAQTVSKNSSDLKKQDQTGSQKQASEKSGEHYIMSGMKQGEAASMTRLIQEAGMEMAPVLKGRELETQGKFSEAIKHYSELLNSKQFEWEAKRGLVRAYEEMGDYQKSIFYLEQSPPKDFARPEWEKKLSELKAKATQIQKR